MPYRGTNIFLGFVAALITTATPQNISPFIIGGEPAARNEFPYQISVQRDGKHICGGALVSANGIVTAAHCVEIGEMSSFTVVAGEYHLVDDDGTEQRKNLSEIIIHESYDPWTLINDIAFLGLASPVNFTAAVQPIALPVAGHTPVGVAVVSGWGTDGEEGDGKISNILEKVGMPLIPDYACMESYDSVLVVEQMLCAGFPTGGIDACRGDAGNPLVCNDLGSPYLCGIFSWGHSNCGEPGFPGVYTEISYFADWIHNKTVL